MFSRVFEGVWIGPGEDDFFSAIAISISSLLIWMSVSGYGTAVLVVGGSSACVLCCRVLRALIH